MAEQKAPGHEFIPVKDLQEGLKFLEEACQARASTIIWRRNKSELHKLKLYIFTPGQLHFYTELPEGQNLVDMPKRILDSKDLTFFFSIAAPKQFLFLKTDFAGADKRGLMFHVPKEIFKVQRRKSIRVGVPPGLIFKVSFNHPQFFGQTFDSKAMDISTGGLSLHVKPAEETAFVPGLFLQNFKFNVKNYRIACNAEVKHKLKITLPNVGDVYKVGVEFSNMKKEDQVVIAQFVFDEVKTRLSGIIK